MAKITFIGIVDHASGKVCQHSDTSFAYRKRSGKTFTVRREIDRVYRPTSAQVIQQENFKQMATAARAFIKKAKTVPAGYKKLVQLYNASEANSMLGFVWKHMDFEDNTITVGGVTYNQDMSESIQG